jgi:hypothetical protein
MNQDDLTLPGITITKVLSLWPEMYGEACLKKCTNFPKSDLGNGVFSAADSEAASAVPIEELTICEK